MSVLAGLAGLSDTLNTLTSDLSNALSQVAQDVGGTWGTLENALLPQFLTSDGTPLPNGKPWGTIDAANTNPYVGAPDTGMTRYYNFTIAPCSMAPDGVYLTNQMCINNQFPGPLIEANYGDYISVTVKNNMPHESGEGTTLHWHGVLQTNTTYMDGVPSISQCPIAPGSSFTYKFRADLYGSSWYHSHYGGQYVGGVFGPLVVYGPSTMNYDIDLGPVMLNDWYHSSWHSLVNAVNAPISQGGGPSSATSNNVLINGKMFYDCSKTDLKCTPNAGVAKFQFQPGKLHRLRLVNSGAQAVQKFSIDGHSMTVVAQDFVPVQPYTTKLLTLGIGQRADVLVNATGKADSAYWMRANIAGCSNNDGISPLGVAAIYYQGANTTTAPNSIDTNGNTAAASCANPDLSVTVPYYKLPMNKPTLTETLTYQIISNGTNKLYAVNGTSFKGDYNAPTLQTVSSSNPNALSFPKQYNVYNLADNATTRFIMYNWNTDWHPMHLHGHNFQVLAVGTGTWDGTVTRQSNPQRRDTQLMPPGTPGIGAGYVVLQWDSDNPGVWPLHCHIAWHVSTGFVFQVVERPEDVKALGKPMADALAGTCKAWSAYTASKVVVDDTDSGV